MIEIGNVAYCKMLVYLRDNSNRTIRVRIRCDLLRRDPHSQAWR